MRIKLSLRNLIKQLFIDFGVVIAASALGFILIILVYLLPVDAIKANIYRGAEVLLEQGSEYLYAGDYKSAILDNETDALILGAVAYKPSSSIDGAVNVPHLIFAGDEGMVYSLFSYLHGDADGQEVSYGRYWHGYVTILKPLFCLFDYSDFRILNQALQLVLVIALIVLLQRRNLLELCLAFVPMLIFWNPATIGVSLQYSPCFYISIISTLLLLWRYRMDRDYFLFFLIVGIVTSYFDFLTYPLATLGVPLTFLCVLRSMEKVDIRALVKEILLICEKWCFGYAVMWAMKWILGSLVSNQNIIEDALSNVAKRSSSMVEDFHAGRLYTCFYIVRSSFLKWPYLIMVIVAIAIIMYMYRGKRISSAKLSILVPFLIIAILPLVWFFATANHSYVHPRLVYRAFGVTIISMFSGVICFLEKCEKK